MTRVVQYIELDLNYCALTYGTSPCTAAIPTTGDRKCFNTLNTCQDRANFDDDGVTYRFAIDADYLPADLEAIPSIVSISLAPSVVSLGENLGIRSSLTVKFKDHRHADTGTGFDKYLADRSYDPWEQGTFFGRWRARHPFVRGRSIRFIRGELGQEIAVMETRHFVVDSFDGPDTNGIYTLIAKDILKLADNDRAVAPRPSNGQLNADITDAATSATLAPSGVGNAEYPASGHVAIGGKEICSFTRSGDVLTLTRAQYNTEAVAHTAEDRVQLCLVYTGEDAADILADLFENYAGVPASAIPLSSWQAETGAYLQRVYTTLIAEPTGVNALASELIEQAALALWWDEVSQNIKLQVLRQIPITAATFDEENVQADTMAISDQRNRRLSEVWTYYAQRNPLRPLTDKDNFRSIQIKINTQNEDDYGSPSIKTILSRWIPAFGGTTADRLNDILLARFSSPPRKFDFEVFRDGVTTLPVLGGGYNASWWSLQDDQGARELVPMQIVSLDARPAVIRASALEMRFDGVELDDPGTRNIIIDTNSFNLNLKTIHDSLFPEITDPYGITVTCTIAAGVYVGSTDATVPAFDVDDGWVAGLDITLVNLGRIQGKGGDGGNGNTGATEITGTPGGTALYSRYDFELDNQGEIYGGGGGGGRGGGPALAGGGGGGSGSTSGAGGLGATSPGRDGSDGTTEAGGAGGTAQAGAGGAFGTAGTAGTGTIGTAGGAAGNAIDGVSYATITTAGTRAGPEIN